MVLELYIGADADERRSYAAGVRSVASALDREISEHEDKAAIIRVY